ncbi:GNAT family N-acetyltransferase [Gloeocapsopsis sp. IPPAS B-1203]|uniref:GNAT family N-acetyltransferase n=1 Tax=Gloeocapsopsis sp. IPPAS B-1203 TaxID=2049454 RepID=UPI000C18E722|nr:GNAT family N-acetyltransferase [Gloeocapsopsis sp. IPPAS B-1203]PIG91730.1 GNAT family N-acetyltransferase [Gloeocapsopsis sp. IPPAS B-1203]
MSLKITQVQTEEHKKHIYRLLEENLTATYLLVQREFSLTFDVDVLLQQDIIKMPQFTSPTGRLLLAYDGNFIGCAGLRKIGEEVGEIKRMYVCPEYRRKGVGRALVQAIISEAQQIGYSKLRLDCAPFAKAAQALYHSIGFQSIQPYPESEIPEEYHSKWIFMELIIK